MRINGGWAGAGARAGAGNGLRGWELRRRSLSLVLGLVLMLALGAGPVGAQDVGLPIGARPGAVVLEDLDGGRVDLAQFVGKRPVLLQFWAQWCPICEALAPQLETISKRYGNRVDVLLVAVGVNQSPRSVKRHHARHPLPGRILWDGRGAATRAFQAPSTSYVVVLDAAGHVAYTGVGDDQDLVAAVAKVVGR